MGHVLVILAVLVVWGAFAFVSPTRACGCAGRCGRCKGTGRRFRLGARLVRRALLKGHQEARRRGRNP